jgi:hypothetical protein
VGIVVLPVNIGRRVSGLPILAIRSGPTSWRRHVLASKRHFLILNAKTEMPNDLNQLFYTTSPRWLPLSGSDCAILACRAILKRQCALSMGIRPGERPFQSRDVSSFRSSRRTSPVSWSERMTVERLTLSM